MPKATNLEAHPAALRGVAVLLIGLYLALSGCGSSTESVVAGPVSPAMSQVLVSHGAVVVGSSTTLTLQARDAQGNNLTSGGLEVAFSTSGGTSEGTISDTEDNGDGTYEAEFTGTMPGTPTTIGATIDGSPVTSTLPTIQVAAAGTPICEAQGSADCWYVAPGGSDAASGSVADPFGTAQRAVDGARPGDFIYLRGGSYPNGFDTALKPGAAGALITIKSSIGETAIIQASLRANASYWRIENLKIEGGQIGQSFHPNLHDIWIVGNEISGHIADLGNNGLIQLTGNVAPDPWNIFIHNNVLYDLRGPSGQSWDQDPDREHHGCITVLRGSGLIEIKDNDISRCASAFYFKFPWNGPIVVEGNLIHDTQQFGQMRNGNNEFRRNVVWNMGRGATTQTDDATGYEFERNTFVGLTPVYDWENLGTHASLDNVIFGAEYLGGSGSPSTADLDGNCFITPSSFNAFDGLSLQQFQSQFGKELNSIRIVETNPTAVFGNPAAADYRLTGDAAAQCSGKGAI